MFHHVVAEAYAPVVKLVDNEINLFVEDVIPQPLVVVRVVVPHIEMHLVCKLDDLVIALRVNESWLEVVIKEPFLAEFLNVFFDEIFEGFTKDSELGHVLFESQACPDFNKDYQS